MQQQLGEVLADGALLTNEAAGLAAEPDVMFCSWKSLRGGQVRYIEQASGSRQFVEVGGAPDLVVQIVSPSSVRKDTKLLLNRYFAAGIAEYWLIDARRAAIDFQLLTRGKTKFAAARPDVQGFRRSGVFGRRFKLTRETNPVGGYSYVLLHKV